MYRQSTHVMITQLQLGGFHCRLEMVSWLRISQANSLFVVIQGISNIKDSFCPRSSNS